MRRMWARMVWCPSLPSGRLSGSGWVVRLPADVKRAACCASSRLQRGYAADQMAACAAEPGLAREAALEAAAEMEMAAVSLRRLVRLRAG